MRTWWTSCRALSTLIRTRERPYPHRSPDDPGEGARRIWSGSWTAVTNHRRAVSAAYYALLHAIIAEAVMRILPVGIASDDDRLRAARWIQHADIKQAARWVVGCAAVTVATGTPPGATGVKHRVWELFSSPGDGSTSDPHEQQALDESFNLARVV